MKRGKINLICTVLALVFGMVFIRQGIVQAQEDAKLIKIKSVGEKKNSGIIIDPKEALVKKNAIVVWLSGVPGEEITIEFADGNKCKSVTAHPMGFDLDKARACYVTSWVPFAATSSLQFTEKGEYPYKVSTAEGISANGKIIVE